MLNETFFLVKGIVAFSAVMLYAGHLWQVKDKPMPGDSTWRLVALFLAGSVVAYDSYQHIRQTDIAADTSNVGNLIVAVVLLIAAISSIRAERRTRGAHER